MSLKPKFFLLTVLIALVSSQLTPSDITFIKSYILSKQDAKNGLFNENACSTYKAIEVLKALNTEIPKSSSICKELQYDAKEKQCPNLVLINKMLKCDFKFDASKISIKSLKEQKDLQKLHKKISYAYLLNAKIEWEEVYDLLTNFLSKNKFSMIKEGKSKSLYATALGIELMGMLYEKVNKKKRDAITSEINSIVNSFQSNFQEVSYEAGIYSEKSISIYKLNSQLIKSLEKIKNIVTISKYDSLRNQILKYFITFKYEIYSLDNIYYIISILQSLSNIPLISVEKNTIDYIEDKTIEVKIVNAFGKELKLTNTTLYYKIKVKEEEKKEGIDLEDDVPLSNKGKVDIMNVSKISVNIKDIIKEAGNYEMSLQLKTKKLKYTQKKKHIIKAMTKLKINHLKMEIINLVDETKSEEEINVEYPKRSYRNFKANQDSVLKLKVKLTSADGKLNKIEQIFLRLKHTEIGKVFSAYASDYRKSEDYYYINFAIDDPVNMESYNGVYELTLVVSDSSLEFPLIWNFGKIEITFIKPDNPSNVNPSYKNPQKPKMMPTFTPEKSLNKNFTIGMAFSFMIIALCFVLIIALKISNVNVKNFPTGASAIPNLLLVMFTVLIAYILVMFWIRLNILQTLGIFTVLFIPGVIIVYKAMKNIQIEI